MRRVLPILLFLVFAVLPGATNNYSELSELTVIESFYQFCPYLIQTEACHQAI